MKKSIVQLAITALITLILSSCARIHVPLHTPENLSDIKTYNGISKANITKTAYPDGTPKYWFKIETGTRKGAFSGVVYHDTFSASTNADTVGLDLLEDGSNIFNIKVAQYNEAAGSGYLVLSIESKARLIAQQAEKDRVTHEAAAAKTEQLNNERKILMEKHCSNFSNVGYFCYDDNNKLEKHDMDAISRLLRGLTQKIIIDNQLGNYYSINSIDVVGQWYVETATDKSINITITMGTKPLAETVIDRQTKAGKPFYIVRKDSTQYFK